MRPTNDAVREIAGFRYDVFSSQVMVCDALPWDKGGLALPARKEEKAVPRLWSERDSHELVYFLYRQKKMNISTRAAERAMQFVAKQRSFNFLLSRLELLRWDGKARADRWLSEYLGAKDCEATRAAGRRFLHDAVARLREPRCTVGPLLAIVGESGCGKSNALMYLFDSLLADDFRMPLGRGDNPYHSSLVRDFAHPRDDMEWCIEFSDALNKVTKIERFANIADLERSKAYAVTLMNRPKKTSLGFVFVDVDGPGHIPTEEAQQIWAEVMAVPPVRT